MLIGEIFYFIDRCLIQIKLIHLIISLRNVVSEDDDGQFAPNTRSFFLSLALYLTLYLEISLEFFIFRFCIFLKDHNWPLILCDFPAFQ